MRTYSISLNSPQIHMLRKMICSALSLDAGENLTEDQERILAECLDALTAESAYSL